MTSEPSRRKTRPAYDPALWSSIPSYAEGKMLDIESKLARAKLYPEIVDMLAQEYKQGEKVLDVGCAGGHFYLTLASVIPDIDYTGADITPEYIEFACEKFPRATWVVSDARSLVFPDKSFDHVLCLLVLIHLDEESIQRTIRELTRVAKKQVVLAGYFATKHVEGVQTTEGKDFIYDVISLDELRVDGWRLEIGTEDGPQRMMKVAADLVDVDGDAHVYEYNLPIHTYVRLVKEE